MVLGAQGDRPARDGSYPGEVVAGWVWLGEVGGWASVDDTQAERVAPERDGA